MTFANSRQAIWIFLLVVGQSGCAALEVDDPELVGTDENEIIGGNEATPGEYPWQVQLQIPGYLHWCGGSIIDTDWVLTAAHCVQGVAAGSFTVRAGLHDRFAPDGNVQTRSVAQVVRHPDYNSATIENDVALLRLSAPFVFTPRVQPIEVATGIPPAGSLAPVSGWGQTAPGSASADELQETILPVQSTATCNAAGTLPLLVRASMVCAGFVGGNSGGCHGDSGGPLVVEKDTFSGGWEQIGVVSWGVGGSCSSYTVFARLSVFAAWIAAQTGPVAIYGDVNGSGCVDAADEAAILGSFGQTVPPASPALDLDQNGVVNIFDRLIVLQNFGDGC
jgi:secreted trypsin-like serine protease